MAQNAQKIALSPSRDIPFNKLVLSQSNVRRIKAGISVDEFAEDIARRGLLQSLSVRPVLDADGVETGMFEIPAGGRRFQALSLLVKQKRSATIQTLNRVQHLKNWPRKPLSLKRRVKSQRCCAAPTSLWTGLTAI